MYNNKVYYFDMDYLEWSLQRFRNRLQRMLKKKL